MVLSEKRRNILLLVVCYLVYTSTYFLKYSYSSNIDMMMFKYGVSKTSVGLVSTLFFITYGIGQFINAFLSRKINIKITLPIVLALSSAINIAVLFIPTQYFEIIKYLWCFNGLILSILWPCTIKTVSENVSDKYKDGSIILFGTVTAVGTCFTYGLSALFKAIKHFELIYIFSALFSAVSIILWVSSYETMTINKKTNFEEEDTNKKDDSFFYIVPTISFITIISFISIVSAFGKEGMQTWFPIILEEKFYTSESFSTLLTVLFPFAAIIASYLSVLFNKKIKNYVLLSGLFILIGIASLSLAWIFQFNEIITLVIACIILSICCAAVANITTSIIPLRIKNKKESGFYAGLFNGCVYIGTALVTYALGASAQSLGWNKTFLIIYILFAFGLLVLIFYYFFTKLNAKSKGIK